MQSHEILPQRSFFQFVKLRKYLVKLQMYENPDATYWFYTRRDIVAGHIFSLK